MHYANGKEAKAGDLVFKPKTNDYEQSEVIGILVSASARSTSCNAQVAVLALRGNSDAGESQWIAFSPGQATWCMTVGELLPVDMPLIPQPSQ